MATRNEGVPESRRMRFRIGINLGDVIHDETRIYGDGINVAARLEGIAEPGGICISRQVFDQVSRSIKMDFQALGPRTLKNIAQPVDVFRDHAGGSRRRTGRGAP
jgi:class 3 adenylate cyclase